VVDEEGSKLLTVIIDQVTWCPHHLSRSSKHEIGKVACTVHNSHRLIACSSSKINEKIFSILLKMNNQRRVSPTGYTSALEETPGIAVLRVKLRVYLMLPLTRIRRIRPSNSRITDPECH